MLRGSKIHDDFGELFHVGIGVLNTTRVARLFKTRILAFKYFKSNLFSAYFSPWLCLSCLDITCLGKNTLWCFFNSENRCCRRFAASAGVSNDHPILGSNFDLCAHFCVYLGVGGQKEYCWRQPSFGYHFRRILGQILEGQGPPKQGFRLREVANMRCWRSCVQHLSIAKRIFFMQIGFLSFLWEGLQ